MSYILVFLGGALLVWLLSRLDRSPDFEILLVRHAQSKTNTREINSSDVGGDHMVPLTEPVGFDQATACGAGIGRDFLSDALLFRSPYLRAEQTMDAILRGAGFSAAEIERLTIQVDPRLREIEHTGSVSEWKTAMKLPHGWFFYRFLKGESPADVFTRISDFLGSMFRLVARKRSRKVVIVSHAISIRVFLMRFFHLSVQQFEALANQKNCEVIRIAPARKLTNPQLTYGKWGAVGLRSAARGDHNSE